MASAAEFRSSSPTTLFRTMQMQHEADVAQFAHQKAELEAAPTVMRSVEQLAWTLDRIEKPLGNILHWKASSHEWVASAPEDQKQEIFDTYVRQMFAIMQQQFVSPITVADSYHQVHRCLGVRAYQLIDAAFAQRHQFHPDAPEAIGCSHAIAVLTPYLHSIADSIPREHLSACHAVTQQFLEGHPGNFSSMERHPAWKHAFSALEDFHKITQAELTLLPALARLLEQLPDLQQMDESHPAAVEFMQAVGRMDDAIALKERVGSLFSIFESIKPLVAEASGSNDLALFCTMAHFLMSTYSVQQLAIVSTFRSQKGLIEIVTNEVFVDLPTKFPSIRLTDEHKAIRREIISRFTTYITTLAKEFSIPCEDPEIEEASDGPKLILEQFRTVYHHMVSAIDENVVAPETCIQVAQALEQTVEGLQHGDPEDQVIYGETVKVAQQLLALLELQGADPMLVYEQLRSIMVAFEQLIQARVAPWVDAQESHAASSSDLGLGQLITDLRRLEMTDPETLIVEAMSKLHT